MAKRVYTKKGDVYEIKIDDTTKRYMQFIGLDWNQLNSDTFRVYKKVYPIDAMPSLEEIEAELEKRKKEQKAASTKGELASAVDGSLDEIAEQLGFNTYNYFSRTFKKYMGVRPREFKAQN